MRIETLRKSALLRVGAAVAAFSLAGFMTACAADGPAESDSDSSSESESEAPAETESSDNTSTSDDDDDEYAFGTDRDQIAQAIEGAFSSKGGSAKWEGDTLVLSLNADSDSPIVGFTECRVVQGLLLENDAAAIAFPSERVDCAEVLGD